MGCHVDRNGIIAPATATEGKGGIEAEIVQIADRTLRRRRIGSDAQ